MSAEGRQYALRVIEEAKKNTGFLAEWNRLSEADKEAGLLYYEQVYDGVQALKQKGKENA